jgi:hypothetical protein
MNPCLYARSSLYILVLLIIGMGYAVFPVSGTLFYHDGSNISPSVLYMLTNSTYGGEPNGPAVFFYDPECGACKPVEAFFDSYRASHLADRLEIVNLSSGEQAEDRLNALYLQYHREWINIPVVFIGPIGIEGTRDIIDNFESVYSWYTRRDRTG